MEVFGFRSIDNHFTKNRINLAPRNGYLSISSLHTLNWHISFHKNENVLVLRELLPDECETLKRSLQSVWAKREAHPQVQTLLKCTLHSSPKGPLLSPTPQQVNYSMREVDLTEQKALKQHCYALFLHFSNILLYP